MAENVFLGHGAHVVLPVELLKRPAGHCVQAPPSGPVYPATHEQFAKDELPVGETECRGHRVHSSKPTDGLKLPNAHATHAPVCPLVKPLLHMHKAEALPDGIMELAGQEASMQLERPETFLNRPAAHETQSPPLGPEYAGLHSQAANVGLPASELECTGQSMHTFELFAASVAEYFPLLQLVHAAAPGNVLKLPLGQATQLPPSGPV